MDGAQDIRGLWKAVSGKVGHIERVEQCGARTVITTAGIIHDLGPNSTGGVTAPMTQKARSALSLGGKEYCMRTSASAVWRNGKLEFNAFGFGPVVVRRYRDGERYDLGIYRRVYYANGTDMHASARAKNTETKRESAGCYFNRHD